MSIHQGGPVWSPYAAEDTMEDIYPDLAKVTMVTIKMRRYYRNVDLHMGTGIPTVMF